MLFHVPDRLQALSEIHRTLRPGGRTVLSDFVAKQSTDEEWDLLAAGIDEPDVWAQCPGGEGIQPGRISIVWSVEL
ncbi:class I SAM-dependent methyltransferase [Nocardia sp. CWNU-33]|uniref:class I SAM-dependent methyltransferase n=1 Tax=Nocardia sp. CWNU-33 TaxID=3392117 RepID=UPI00398EDF5F